MRTSFMEAPLPRVKTVNAGVRVDHVRRDAEELLEAGAERVPEIGHLRHGRRRVEQGLQEARFKK